jgi:enoyl-[acyl-carrier protein] reductase I
VGRGSCGTVRTDVRLRATVGISTAALTGRLLRCCGAFVGPRSLLRCDVRCDKEISEVAAAVGSRSQGRLDALLHAVAFAPAAALRGGSLLSTSREAWTTTLDVSAYSLLSLTRGLHPLLQAAASNTRGGDGRVHYGPSITTLSYVGARKAVPEYLVMGPAKAALEATARGLAAELGPEGIRVNVISAGPVRTVAAKSIPGFSTMTKSVEEHAPLRRNISAVDVAGLATFLASDAASAITGQTMHVDAGHSAVWV